MKDTNRKLGMVRDITRRDVIHGIGAVGAGLELPGVLQGHRAVTELPAL